MMRKTLVIVSLFLIFAGNVFSQSGKKGLIAKLSIEGTQDTEMSAFHNGSMVEGFKSRIYATTVARLKQLYSLEDIQFADQKGIVFKQGLNRLAGVKKLDKDLSDQVSKVDYTFVIKCDIAFNETTGGFIIDKTSSRAAIYVSVGVFDPQGKLLTVFKEKSKDGVVFLGKNARKVQWLGMADFEAAYSSALSELKAEE